MRTIASNWLVVWIFAASLAAGVWVFGRTVPLAALAAAVVAVAAIWKWPFALEMPEERARIGIRDVALTLCIAAPSMVNLAGSWHKEFPTSGDQFVHNGYGLEAYNFWWPWGWLAAIVAIAMAIVAVRRNARSVLPFLGFMALAILARFDFEAAFVVRYPSMLHFMAVPFRAILRGASPIDIERLINTASIPVWLLVLRPRLLGRNVDLTAAAAGLLLFWQKDDVYYMSSGYLEPWAIVLLLTAGEHLIRFRETGLWRPLLLIGTAALFKDQAIITLPIVAVVFFPRRNVLPHLATVAAAALPFGLWALHPGSNVFRAAGFLAVPLRQHAAMWAGRVSLQFGTALPVAATAVAALIALALRNRGALALLLAAVADWALFFFSAVQREWPGYPRTNLVPLAYAALALGFVLEPLHRKALFAVAAIAALNAVPLVPFLAEAFEVSDERNFFEHHDAPIYYPIREILDRQTLVPARGSVDVLYNGRRLYSFYFPGMLGDEYPDLASRYRMRMQSFAGAPERCRCTATEAKLAVFIRFKGPGAARPERGAINAEAARCRSFLEATCGRRITVTHDGAVVGVLGAH